MAEVTHSLAPAAASGRERQKSVLRTIEPNLSLEIDEKKIEEDVTHHVYRKQ